MRLILPSFSFLCAVSNVAAQALRDQSTNYHIAVCNGSLCAMDIYVPTNALITWITKLITE